MSELGDETSAGNFLLRKSETHIVAVDSDMALYIFPGKKATSHQ